MRAPLPWRSLFSVGLGLLLLITTVRCTCLSSYSQLLSQLQNQATYLQNPENLLKPYVISRGLGEPPLNESCKEHLEGPGAFPSEEALSTLSRRGLLMTVSATSDRVLSRLEAWKNRFSLPEQLQTAILYLKGLKNNLSCMIGLLKASEPTQASPRTLPPPSLPSPTQGIFQDRLDGCRFLHGYQRFMHSVHEVLSQWGDSRSRRQSFSHQGQGKQAHGSRIRPSVGRVRTARPRAQLHSRS